MTWHCYQEYSRLRSDHEALQRHLNELPRCSLAWSFGIWQKACPLHQEDLTGLARSTDHIDHRAAAVLSTAAASCIPSTRQVTPAQCHLGLNQCKNHWQE